MRLNLKLGHPAYIKTGGRTGTVASCHLTRARQGTQTGNLAEEDRPTGTTNLSAYTYLVSLLAWDKNNLSSKMQIHNIKFLLDWQYVYLSINGRIEIFY